jgi:hypothetical protein
MAGLNAGGGPSSPNYVPPDVATDMTAAPAAPKGKTDVRPA